MDAATAGGTRRTQGDPPRPAPAPPPARPPPLHLSSFLNSGASLEVFCSHIAPYLSPADLRSLRGSSRACRAAVHHSIRSLTLSDLHQISTLARSPTSLQQLHNLARCQLTVTTSTAAAAATAASSPRTHGSYGYGYDYGDSPATGDEESQNGGGAASSGVGDEAATASATAAGPLLLLLQSMRQHTHGLATLSVRMRCGRLLSRPELVGVAALRNLTALSLLGHGGGGDESDAWGHRGAAERGGCSGCSGSFLALSSLSRLTSLGLSAAKDPSAYTRVTPLDQGPRPGGWWCAS